MAATAAAKMNLCTVVVDIVIALAILNKISGVWKWSFSVIVIPIAVIVLIHFRVNHSSRALLFASWLSCTSSCMAQRNRSPLSTLKRTETALRTLPPRVRVFFLPYA